MLLRFLFPRQRDAAPTSQISPLWGLQIFMPAFLAGIMFPPRSGSVTLHPCRELHLCEVPDFYARVSGRDQVSISIRWRDAAPKLRCGSLPTYSLPTLPLSRTAGFQAALRPVTPPKKDHHLQTSTSSRNTIKQKTPAVPAFRTWRGYFL